MSLPKASPYPPNSFSKRSPQVLRSHEIPKDHAIEIKIFETGINTANISRICVMRKRRTGCQLGAHWCHQLLYRLGLRKRWRAQLIEGYRWKGRRVCKDPHEKVSFVVHLSLLARVRCIRACRCETPMCTRMTQLRLTRGGYGCGNRFWSGTRYKA